MLPSRDMRFDDLSPFFWSDSIDIFCVEGHSNQASLSLWLVVALFSVFIKGVDIFGANVFCIIFRSISSPHGWY